MATTLHTNALEHFGRNWWVRNIINDGVEKEPWMGLE